MQKPDDIPEDVWGAARTSLYAAYDALEARAGSGSFITSGMWEALIEASSRAILAERVKWELAAQYEKLDMSYRPATGQTMW